MDALKSNLTRRANQLHSCIIAQSASLGRVLINPAARCDEGYVRFAAIATKFVQQRNMSRWTQKTTSRAHRDCHQ